MALIAPSLVAANFARLGEALEIIKTAGASIVHVDVMDGHFVPDIAMGQPVVASLRKATDLTLDVHLLIEWPERYAAEFIDAGGDRVSVHPESTPNFHGVLELIRKRGAQVGAALNPATPVESISDVLGALDFLMILSAHPGAREQEFIAGSVEKIRAATQLRQDRRLNFALQVEGGVTLDNLEQLVRAGADILVAGSAIFHGGDAKGLLSEMIRVARGTHQVLKT